MNADKQDLTTGKVAPKLMLFFLPILLGLLFQQLYNTVDALIVGRFVGDAALAAVGGSAASITNLIIGFFTGLNTGASVLIAQKYGAKDGEALKKVLHTAIVFCLIVGVLITVLLIIFAPQLLRLLNTPEDVLDDSAVYLRVYSLGAVFLLMNNLFQETLHAVGDARRPLIYLLISCVTNVVLDLLAVAVLKMGVAGAAAASVVSMGVCVLLAGVHLLRSDGPQRIIPKELKITPPVMRNILHIGLPSGLQGVMYSLSNMIIMVAVNGFGTATVTAWTATGKVDGFYWAASSAFGVALCAFVGQCYGAGKIDRMKESIRTCFIIAMITTVAMSVTILAVAPAAYGLFLSDPEIVRLAVTISWYFVPTYVIWTVIEILSASFRGVGETFAPMIIIMLGTCVFRVLWTVTVFRWWNTLMGLSMVYPASWLLTAIVMVIYYRKSDWLSKRLPNRGEAPG